MDLHDEREELSADTSACIGSVSETSPPLVPNLLAPSPLVARHRPPEPERSDIDIRREMQERLSAFRNRQRLQEIERNVFYEQAMQRIRAVTDQWA